MRRPTVTFNCPTVEVKRKAVRSIKKLHKDMTMTRLMVLIAEFPEEVLNYGADFDELINGKDGISSKFNLRNYKP